MKKITCKECNQPVANTNNVLARHLRAVHELDWASYVVRHEFGGMWPICECGCNEELPWRKGGFAKFIKGHDNKGDQNPMAKKRAVKEVAMQTIKHLDESSDGWFPNPWTGQEEHFDSDVEQQFIVHCTTVDDPITKDHGFKIGWDDSSGALRIYVPNFRHIKRRLIFDLGGFSDAEGQRRLTSVKEWCDQHGFMMLSLRPSSEGSEFDVVSWYRPREFNE